MVVLRVKVVGCRHGFVDVLVIRIWFCFIVGQESVLLLVAWGLVIDYLTHCIHGMLLLLLLWNSSKC